MWTSKTQNSETKRDPAVILYLKYYDFKLFISDFWMQKIGRTANANAKINDKARASYYAVFFSCVTSVELDLRRLFNHVNVG